MRSDAALPAGDLTAGLVEPGLTVGKVTAGSLDDQGLAFPDPRPPKQWYLALAFTSTMLLIGLFFMGVTV